jgi:signal transduction histidine kinase
MAQRPDHTYNQHQLEKLATIGLAAGNLAHDLNNMLQIINARIELLGRQTLPRPGEIGKILSVVGQARTAIDALLGFLREEPAQQVASDVGELVEQTAILLELLLPNGIMVTTQRDPVPCIARLDPHRFQQAIINLAINARDSMPHGGTLHLSVSSQTAQDGHQDGGMVTVSVSDTGSGMPPEVLARAQEPFFTTKAIKAGTGLGLSQVTNFVRDSGGSLVVESDVRVGTKVTLRLPASRAETSYHATVS